MTSDHRRFLRFLAFIVGSCTLITPLPSIMGCPDQSHEDFELTRSSHVHKRTSKQNDVEPERVDSWSDYG